VSPRNGRKLVLVGSAALGGVLIGAIAGAAPAGHVAAPVEVEAPSGLIRPLAATDPVEAAVAVDVLPADRQAALRSTRDAWSDELAAQAAAEQAAAEHAAAEEAAAAAEEEARAAAEAEAQRAADQAARADNLREESQDVPPQAPPPEPAPAPAPSGSPSEQAIAHWFPDVYDQAVRVARCESGMNPNAVSSGGGNHGLFQINSVHRDAFTSVTGQPWSSIYDPYYNSQYARHLYNRQGWSPWGCRP
jgi:Transglycosylase SLT domain